MTTDTAICPHCKTPNPYSCFMGRGTEPTGRETCSRCGKRYRWHRTMTTTTTYETEELPK